MLNCFAHRQYVFGIPVLLLHDFSDAFVNKIRLVREIKGYESYAIPVYLVFISVWIFTRNFVFNVEIVYPLFTDQIFKFWEQRRFNHIFATFGLSILMILNTYWVIGMLITGYRKITSGYDKYVSEETDENARKEKSG
jgi:hypothetical protein